MLSHITKRIFQCSQCIHLHVLSAFPMKILTTLKTNTVGMITAA
ncbi:hypothetical protein KKPNMP14_55920 [Klebsiella pneumoniae subsp. pneumoniae MP14]|nr:hypothetical protein KKPNMP14_55920 [Klebsiella pneumoniae subsp. pneumoniae MP14]EPS10511.1 hypothetical protein UKKV901664_23540 [Klebsiella pneumoniae subsp. pneumoniae UKKV901664]QVQ59931.1 hypothetical protein [Enterobacter cloacae complex sp.]QVQ60213.1 hypothetical protein [Enterobacter cloacae complex sp.]